MHLWTALILGTALGGALTASAATSTGDAPTPVLTQAQPPMPTPTSTPAQAPAASAPESEAATEAEPAPEPGPDSVPVPELDPAPAPAPARAPAPASAPTPDAPATTAPVADTIEIGRPDGSRQCEPDSGVPIDAMIATLRDAGIEVHGSRSAHDGLNRIAVCGAPTGQFHLFRIDPADLAAAEALGFRPMPPLPPSAP